MTMVYSSQSNVFPTFLVRCLDGSYAQDASKPCSTRGAPVDHFVVRVTDRSGGAPSSPSTITTNVPVSQANCAAQPLGRGDRGGAGASLAVRCTAHAGGNLAPYHLWSVEVATAFASGGSGATSAFNDFFNTSIVTSDFVTPQLLADHYGIPTGMDGNVSRGAYVNSQSVAEFSGQFYSPADLEMFFQSTGVSPANVTVVGPNNASQPGDEATLDIQWIMGVGQGVPTTFWSVGDDKYLLEWAEELSSSDSPPLVNSISYSDNEADTARSFMDRVDVELMKLGVRGVSVLVAAGDAGATNVGHGSDNCSFAPQYPASSPWATSVSATMLTPRGVPLCHQGTFAGVPIECARPVLEAAVSADDGMVWTTGGGFSNVYPRPAYQRDAVDQYLRQEASRLPPANMWNSSARGYPDVSAIGHNLIVYDGGRMDLSDGTSASTPIFAGIVALLNGELLADHQPPLGFLNPLLYAMRQQQHAAFFDVTVGNNKCGDVLHPPHVLCCDHGFYASVGWDAVTGLGTPNYKVLSEMVKAI